MKTSNMDYEKKYKEALERIRSLHRDYNQISTLIDVKEELENIFPELAESEGEEIRKALLEMVHDTTGDSLWVDYNVHKEDAIAWFEKQGNLVKYYEYKLDRCACDNFNKGYKKALEKQGEQKFEIEEGKWYVCIRDLLDNYANKAFCKGDIYLSTQNGSLIPSNSNVPFEVVCPDTYFKDWTILDAKDGDVLFTSSTASHETFIFKSIDKEGNVKCYSAYDSEDGFREGKYHFIGRATNCKPATKEQRDTLINAMADAGYTFDFEKKELKMIEQKPTEEYNITGIGSKNAEGKLGEMIRNLNPLGETIQRCNVWSEEDESHIRYLIECLEHCKKGVALTMTTSTAQEYINWLKSLRPQSHWKPSDEHYELEEFAKIVRCNLTGISKAVQKLFETKYLQLTGNKMYGGFKD